MAARQEEANAYIYRSRFGEWNSRAGVRAKPRRVLLEDDSPEREFFSSGLVPLIDHPLVVNLGPESRRKLLVHHLYHYLDFTANFEIEVVNPAARMIALGNSGLELPPEMLLDAYKIYCDEGYHSFFSADIKLQVQAATGVEPLPYHFSEFLQRLHHAHDTVPQDLKHISGLLIVVVFETLISSILNTIPKDKRVVPAVREMVSDHAEDEAKHHAYFSALFDLLWRRPTKQERTILGPILPHFIVKSLEPDYLSIRRRLATFHLKPEEIDQIMEESYPWKKVIANLRKTASATLHLFERNGLFEDQQTLDAFRASGLLR